MAHEAGDTVAAHLEASGPELLMDAWCAVEAAVPFKHGLELGAVMAAFSWARGPGLFCRCRQA